MYVAGPFRNELPAGFSLHTTLSITGSHHGQEPSWLAVGTYFGNVCKNDVVCGGETQIVSDEWVERMFI